MFTFEDKIRYSEVDEDAKLNIHGILNYFQDCSTLQSEGLGVGLENLKEKNLFWVLSTWQIEVLRYPKLNEKVVTGTFPYDFRGFFGRRNFFMKDEEDNMIARADSLWMLLDIKEGKPSKITPEIENAYETEEKLPMETIRSKIKIPEEALNDPKVRKNDILVRNHHIDPNKHVNNGKYVEMLMDEVPNLPYRRLRVEYRKQVRPGEILTPYIYDDGEVISAILKDREDEVCTAMELLK